MLSENIKEYRKKRKISQDKLSKLADITHTTLAKLESGVNVNPTIRTIKRIANALNVSIDDLLK